MKPSLQAAQVGIPSGWIAFEYLPCGVTDDHTVTGTIYCIIPVVHTVEATVDTAVLEFGLIKDVVPVTLATIRAMVAKALRMKDMIDSFTYLAWQAFLW